MISKNSELIMPPRGRKTAKKDLDGCDKMSEVNAEPLGRKSRKCKATTTVTVELSGQGIGQEKRRKTEKEDNDKEPPAADLNQNGSTALPSKNAQEKLQETSNSSEPSGQSEAQEVLNSGGSQPSADRISSDWFNRPCIDLGQCLLGMKLVRISETGERLSGVIVETESYLGGEDKASHSYNGKRTDRIKAMYMAPGTAYVYNIYGVYTCINISSQGDGAAVLIRSLEPSEGEDLMRKARSVKKSDKSKELKREQLCNGPSKLTQALGVTKANGDQVDLTTSPCIWVEKGTPNDKNDIVTCKRIGINYAEEWTDKPLRFYVRGCPSVSVRDKVAEAKICD